MKTCNDCQLCCKTLTLAVAERDHRWLEFYRAWGLEGKLVSGKYYFRIPYPCQHCGDGKCNDYENRPEVCRQQEPDILRDAMCREGLR